MQINWIDDSWSVPLNKFRRLCQTHEDNLPALMVAKQLWRTLSSACGLRVPRADHVVASSSLFDGGAYHVRGQGRARPRRVRHVVHLREIWKVKQESDHRATVL